MPVGGTVFVIGDGGSAGLDEVFHVEGGSCTSRGGRVTSGRCERAGRYPGGGALNTPISFK